VGTSRPLGGRDALGASSRIRKVSYPRRGSRGVWEKFWDLPPVGWAGGLRPHASRPLIGREAPIFQKFSKRLTFFEFNFLTFFLKKSLLHCGDGGGMACFRTKQAKQRDAAAGLLPTRRGVAEAERARWSASTTSVGPRIYWASVRRRAFGPPLSLSPVTC
jgi:hypothetical protein